MNRLFAKKVLFCKCGIFCFIAAVILLLETNISISASSDPGGNKQKSPAEFESSPEGFEYKIGLGDILEVLVWKEDELSRDTTPVRVDGRISLPLIGDVVASGKSTRELAAGLEKRFSEFIGEPVVSVILKLNRSQRYYIMGQVGEPGEFLIEFPTTIVQAIAKSKGFLEWAQKSKITVIRRESGEEKMLNFDYEAFLKGKSPEDNVLLVPGDTIIVP